MSESGLIDLPEEASPRRRSAWRRFGLPLLVVLALAVLGLGAARVHYGNVAVDTWRIVHAQAPQLDRGQQVLSHGDFAPCDDGAQGRIERIYRPGERATMRLTTVMNELGWTQQGGTAGQSANASITWRSSFEGEVSAEFDPATGRFLILTPNTVFGCLPPPLTP